jgi:hypothetical protein
MGLMLKQKKNDKMVGCSKCRLMHTIGFGKDCKCVCHSGKVVHIKSKSDSGGSDAPMIAVSSG